MGGITYLSDGADTLQAVDANAASVLGGTENDSFQFTGNVKDSSLVGGFGVDSLVLGNGATDFVRGSTIYGGSPLDGGSALDGADYITVAGSLSSSAVYGNSGADSLLIGGNATAASLFGGADNDLVSVSANVSAGQIFTGSGVDEVIITGSLLGAATVRLENSGRTEETADSITIGNISSVFVYGEAVKTLSIFLVTLVKLRCWW